MVVRAPVRHVHRVLRRMGRGEIEGLRDEAGHARALPRRRSCTIYERRPSIRAAISSADISRRDSPFPEEFRPDQLGVMIIPIKWRGIRAYILRSAPRDPDEQLIAWMRDFSLRMRRPFFYEQAGERYGFGPRSSSGR
jgi:hypothetical protein